MEQTIADRIKQIRKAENMTQEQFAEKIGCSRGALANYEIGRNEPLTAVIKSICREFNISEAWLRNGEEPKNADEARRKALAKAVGKARARGDPYIAILQKAVLDLSDEPERLMWLLDKVIELGEQLKAAQDRLHGGGETPDEQTGPGLID